MVGVVSFLWIITKHGFNSLYNPYENFTYHFTCHCTCEKHIELEQFRIGNFHFTCEIGTFSHSKYIKIIWNKLVENFTCEILVHETYISHMKWNILISKLISYMKFSFHKLNWNNSHMKYYFNMWNCMWDFCKGIVCLGLFLCCEWRTRARC